MSRDGNNCGVATDASYAEIVWTIDHTISIPNYMYIIIAKKLIIMNNLLRVLKIKISCYWFPVLNTWIVMYVMLL